MFNKIKNAVLIFLLFVLGGTLISCANSSTPMNTQKGNIFINGVELKEQFALIHSKPYHVNGYWRAGTELPFIAILKEYGFNIVWDDDSNAKLYYKSKTYFLDLIKVEVAEEKGGKNFLVPEPGSGRSYTVIDKELYLDYSTLRFFMSLIDEDINIRVNYDTLCVNVSF